MDHYNEQTIELTERVECTFGIEFTTYGGCPGDYWTPAEPPEIEITSLEVGTLIGANWEKSGRELHESGWLDFLLATKRFRQIERDLDRHFDYGRLSEQAATEEYDPN